LPGGVAVAMLAGFKGGPILGLSGWIMSEAEAWLYEKLVCPLSKAPVVRVGEWLYSTDARTRRRYRIRDGIPTMLIDESELVSPDEFERVMREHQVSRSVTQKGTES
jgi:uncharacterized protein YbaR (Trm112 family)